MAMAAGSGKGSIAEPNIVPLIDVLLVLIIIFMVITPIMPQGLEARLPQLSSNDSESRDLDRSQTIVVQVVSGGKVLINQQEVS